MRQATSRGKWPGHRSDEELAVLAQGGGEQAFSELVERHAARLRRLVRRRLPRKVDRRVSLSDVIQEAWVVVFERLPDFEPSGRGSFRHWLDRIVANKLGDNLRRHLDCQKRNMKRERSRGDRLDTEQQVGRLPSPSANAIAAETQESLEREMAALAPDQAFVLRLVYTEHKTIEEAAAVLGRSREATRKLYGRTLVALAARLGIEGKR